MRCVVFMKANISVLHMSGKIFSARSAQAAGERQVGFHFFGCLMSSFVSMCEGRASAVVSAVFALPVNVIHVVSP